MELSNKSLIKNFPHAITICSVGEFQYLELVRQLYNSILTITILFFQKSVPLYSVKYSFNQCINCIFISCIGLFNKSVGYHHADGPINRLSPAKAELSISKLVIL